jgi:hypothetical protein
MVHIGMSALDVAARALLEGNFAFFWDQKPHVQHTGSATQDILAARYMRHLGEIAQGKMKVVSREELQDMLGYIVGGMPASPYKFTSLIKHHGLMLEPLWRDGRTVRGLKVDWTVGDEIRKEMGIEAGSDVRPVQGGPGDDGVQRDAQQHSGHETGEPRDHRQGAQDL